MILNQEAQVEAHRHLKVNLHQIREAQVLQTVLNMIHLADILQLIQQVQVLQKA